MLFRCTNLSSAGSSVSMTDLERVRLPPLILDDSTVFVRFNDDLHWHIICL